MERNADATDCHRVALQDLDPYLLGNAFRRDVAKLYAYRLRNLQVVYDRRNEISFFGADAACLNSVENPQAAVFDNFASATVQSRSIPFHSNVETPCLTVSGRWVLGTYGSHIVNMYDDLVLNTYPLYMAVQELYAHADDLFVSHMQAPSEMPEGWRWLSMYEVLGSYVQWDMLREGAMCIMFEEAVIAESTFWWQRKPVAWGASQTTPMLQAYVHAFLNSQPSPIVDSCSKKVLLYAKRVGKRKVVNSDQFEDTIRAVGHGFETRVVLLEKMVFEKQVFTVRSASIYIFPHGAGGAHVLWLSPGAVAIELYPLNWANPMYRNLALMSGTTFLAYQAEAQHIVDNRNADYEINLVNFSPVLQSAMMVASNNLGDNWFNCDRPYNVSVNDLSVIWTCAEQTRTS